MKWLVVIIALAVIAVALIWLRTARQTPGSSNPHRLDESVTPLGDAGDPLPPGGQAVAGGSTGGPPVDLPSNATWAGEEAGPSEPDGGDDLPPSETRPSA